MAQLPEAVTPFDPSNVETRTELGVALDALRLRCGLSYEQMERAAGRLPPGSGRLAHSTIGDIVRAKTLPQPETFHAFLRVCNVPSDDVPGWLAARNARQRRTCPVRPARSGSATPIHDGWEFTRPSWSTSRVMIFPGTWPGTATTPSAPCWTRPPAAAASCS